MWELSHCFLFTSFFCLLSVYSLYSVVVLFSVPSAGGCHGLMLRAVRSVAFVRVKQRLLEHLAAELGRETVHHVGQLRLQLLRNRCREHVPQHPKGRAES